MLAASEAGSVLRTVIRQSKDCEEKEYVGCTVQMITEVDCAENRAFDVPGPRPLLKKISQLGFETFPSIFGVAVLEGAGEQLGEDSV